MGGRRYFDGNRSRVRFSGVCPVVVAAYRCRWVEVVVGLYRTLDQKRSRAPSWIFRSRGLRGWRGGRVSMINAELDLCESISRT